MTHLVAEVEQKGLAAQLPRRLEVHSQMVREVAIPQSGVGPIRSHSLQELLWLDRRIREVTNLL